MGNSSVPSPKRKKTVRKKRRKTLDILIYLFIALVVFTGYQPVKEYFASKLLDYTYLQYGVLEDQITTDALLIKTEQIVSGSGSSVLSPIVGEGERAANGQVIASAGFSGNKQNLRAPFAGMVSYKIDGLEGSLKPGCWEQISLSEVLKNILTQKEAAEQAQTQTNKKENKEKEEDKQEQNGDIVIENRLDSVKVIDNLREIYVYLEIPQRSSWPEMTEGTSFQLHFPNAIAEKASIMQVKDNGETRQVLFEIRTAKNLALSDRLQKCSLVLDSWKGYLAPVSAICYDEAQKPRIMVVKKNKIAWQEIEIVSQVGEQVVIQPLDGASLNTSTPIITNPERAKEGQKVYF